MDVSLENVRVSYGGNEPALYDVCTSFKTGTITVLVGPNGSGKSTLLHAILRLVSYDGLIKYDDIVFRSRLPDRMRKHIGFAGGLSYVPRELTANQYFRMLSFLYDINRDILHDRISWLTNYFQINFDYDCILATFSSGMCHIIDLFSAILHNPRLLILDEPFVHIDEGFKALFIDFLKEYSSGDRTIILSSHEVNSVSSLGPNLLMLDSGSIIYDGAYKESIGPRTVLSEQTRHRWIW